MNAGTHTSLIRRARLPRAGDALAAGARLARLLAAEDLTPAGLPANALLLVRRLRTPAPDCATHDIRPPAPWVRALGADLDRLRAAAAHPGDGPVPPGAEAVIFADVAELLACLARDWVAGDAAQRWWWKLLLPRGLDAAEITRLWLEHVPFVPAALRALQAGDAAAPFLRRLEAPAVGLLVKALATRHGLGALHEALAGGGIGPGHAPRPRQSGDPPRAATPAAAPWRDLVAAAEAAALDAPRQLLLGLAVTLHRAPARARAAGFAAAVARWLHRHEPVITDPACETRPPDAPVPAAPAVATGDAPPSPTAPPMNAAAAGTVAVPEAPPAPAAAAAPPTPGAKTVPAPAASLPTRARRTTHASPPGTRPAAKAPPFPETPRSPASPAAAAPRPFFGGDAGETLRTGFAGIFFLANLALRLDLYGDFSRPLHRGLDLPFWDFIALAGEALAGPALRDDPVWALLAALAGRPERSQPGRGWQPPGEWRLMPEWLAPFPGTQPCRWQARSGRLWVMHPEGFTVLDLPLRGRSAREVLAIEGLAEVVPEPSSGTGLSAETAGPRRLRRWLGWLAPYLRARLRLALGLSGDTDPGPFLCRHAGRLETGTATLDLRLSLDRHPVQIRIAGLDRDPGWIPAAGRSIRFHFD